MGGDAEAKMLHPSFARLTGMLASLTSHEQGLVVDHAQRRRHAAGDISTRMRVAGRGPARFARRTLCPGVGHLRLAPEPLYWEGAAKTLVYGIGCRSEVKNVLELRTFNA